MTATAFTDVRPPEPARPVVVVTTRARRAPSGPAPLASASLSILAAVLLGFVAYVTVIGHVTHARDQQVLYADLRQQLAEATAPVGQTGADGGLLPLGTPVALLEVPGLGLREVVVEGTTSGVLRSGAGHRRDSVLPGQAGTSVLFGRKAGFGSPFADIAALPTGTPFFVTTGQGRHEFRVSGRRGGGDPAPAPLAPGKGRLTLVTATGPSYLPEGALRVDADLVTPAQPVPARPLTSASLPEAEQALQGDTTVLLAVLLWLQGLVLAACGVAWARARWGRRQAWVVGVPLLGSMGLGLAGSAVQLLPNLL